MNEQENEAFEDDKFGRAFVAAFALLGAALLWLGKSLFRIFLSGKNNRSEFDEIVARHEQDSRDVEHEILYHSNDCK